MININFHYAFVGNQDSIVSIVTGYGLDDWGVEVRAPVGSRIFSSPSRPDWLWDPHILLSNGYWGLFPQGNAAREWSWPLTSNYCQGQENVDLYIHSPIHLHGVVLHLLSTWTTFMLLLFHNNNNYHKQLIEQWHAFYSTWQIQKAKHL
jgi:hypothetical protein